MSVVGDKVNDTIVAQATAHGEAAISIIRISGPATALLIAEIFERPKVTPRYCYRGDYRSRDGELLDDLLYVYFRAPSSYTGDDLAELYLHGNPLIVQKVLEDLQRRGCRMAEPGEFTRLAFMSGKIDLSQAEAVIDLIRAQGDMALRAAHVQLRGGLSGIVENAIERLLVAIAEVEAYIDFPEEDLPPEDQGGPLRAIDRLRRDLLRLASTAKYGGLLREGVRTVIVGAPNAGKSSLLNRLLNEDRALVTDIAGTTRDSIEAQLNLGAYRIRIVDTAGIRQSTDTLELMSIDRTMREIRNADLFLLVLDATLPHPTLTEELESLLNRSNTLVVQNKSDLPKSIGMKRWKDFREVSISALTGDGIDRLLSDLEQIVDEMNPLEGEEFVAVSARHAVALEEAAEALAEGLKVAESRLPSELIASHLREALHALGTITGTVDNERMLDRLFSTFCIGK